MGVATRIRAAAAGRRLVALAAGGVVALSCTRSAASQRELDGFRRLRGDLVAAETLTARPRGRYAAQRIRLTSSTGLVATGWLVRPAVDTGCYPAALLQDGREENSGVIGRLPPDYGDVVVLSLDYPAEIPYGIELRDVVLHGGRLERAADRIPALFDLGAEYLARRRDVDSARITLAATSFAVPFATIAAAGDPRFRNVALIYGAGDLSAVLAANLTTRPRFLRRPLAWLAMRPFAELAPERYIARIAPRPIVMVNGIDDPQMPVPAVRRLYDAARQPKTLIWLRTGHLMPADSALIRALVDTAFDRLPALHEPARAARCGR